MPGQEFGIGTRRSKESVALKTDAHTVTRACKQWRDCGRFGEGYRVFSMASFKGSLYTGDDTGKCYRYDGDQSWTFCGQVSGNEHRLKHSHDLPGPSLRASHGSFFRY